MRSSGFTQATRSVKKLVVGLYACGFQFYHPGPERLLNMPYDAALPEKGLI